MRADSAHSQGPPSEEGADTEQSTEEETDGQKEDDQRLLLFLMLVLPLLDMTRSDVSLKQEEA